MKITYGRNYENYACVSGIVFTQPVYFRQKNGNYLLRFYLHNLGKYKYSGGTYKCYWLRLKILMNLTRVDDNIKKGSFVQVVGVIQENSIFAFKIHNFDSIPLLELDSDFIKEEKYGTTENITEIIDLDKKEPA